MRSGKLRKESDDCSGMQWSSGKLDVHAQIRESVLVTDANASQALASAPVVRDEARLSIFERCLFCSNLMCPMCKIDEILACFLLF